MSDTLQQQPDDECQCEYRGVVYRTYGELTENIRWTAFSEVLRKQAEQAAKEAARNE